MEFKDGAGQVAWAFWSEMTNDGLNPRTCQTWTPSGASSTLGDWGAGQRISSGPAGEGDTRRPAHTGRI